MMHSHHSEQAACEIAEAAMLSKQAIERAAMAYTYPSVVYRPKMTRDGNRWCALYGDDIQSGVCGFGDSPHAAMQDFDRAWIALAEPFVEMSDADIRNEWRQAGGKIHGPIVETVKMSETEYFALRRRIQRQAK